MQNKHIPMRMCIGCGKMNYKYNLIRIVKVSNTNPHITVDLNGKTPGRGAYLCRDAICLKNIRKTRRLSRIFSCGISDDFYAILEKEINQNG